MTSNKKPNEKVKIEFINCTTYGQEVEALTRYFCDTEIKTWVLEQAIQNIKKVEQKQKDALEEIFKSKTEKGLND